MTLITEPYREQNRLLHAARPDYGAYGHRWIEPVVALITRHAIASMLDYGAGKGTLIEALAPQFPLLTMTAYDPAVTAFAARPTPAELLVCGDVLEHIEPDCLDAVLDDIASLALRFAFLVISTVPAKKTLPDGRNTHLIVQPMDWWLPQLFKRWSRIELAKGDVGFIAVACHE